MEPPFRALSRPDYEPPENIAAGFQFQAIKQPKSSARPVTTANHPLSKSDSAGDHPLSHTYTDMNKTHQPVPEAPVPVESTGSQNLDWDDPRGIPFPDAFLSRDQKKLGSVSRQTSLPQMTQEQIAKLRRSMPVYNKLVAQQKAHESRNSQEASETTHLCHDHPSSHTDEAMAKTDDGNPTAAGSRSGSPEPVDMVRVPEPNPSHPECERSPRQGYSHRYLPARRGSVTRLGDLEFGSASPKSPRHLRRTANAPSRPVRASKNDDFETSALRPPSSGSNISKRRQPALTPSELRPGSHRVLTAGRVGGPQRATAAAGKTTILPDTQNFQTLRNAWNSFFSHINHREQQAKFKMDCMQAQIGDQLRQIHEYSNELKTQGHDIKALTAENHDLKHQLEDFQKHLEDSACRAQKLGDKCRLYREQLNKATAEQQKLYLRSKDSFQKAISELKAEEQRRQNTTQAALSEAETVKANIQKQVAAAISEAKENAAGLNANISKLNGQLEDRQKELLQEKEQVKQLKIELDDSRRLNSLALESVREQNECILEAVKEERQHAQAADSALSEQRQRMNTVETAFNELSSKSLTRESIAELLQASRDETVKTVVSEVQRLVAAESISNAGMERVTENLDSLKQICRDIQTLTEQSQAQSQKSDQAMINILRVSEQRVQKAEHEFQALNAVRLQCSADSKALSGEIAGLLENVRDLQQQVRATHSSTERTGQLEEELAVKMSAISELREKLRDVETQLQTRNDTFKLKQAELREKVETLQQALEEAHHQQDSSREAAAAELQSVQDAKQDADKRLQSSHRARSQLELALQNVQDKLAQLSSSRDFDTADLERLDRSTRDEATKVEELTEKLSVVMDIQPRLMILLQNWARDGQLHANLRADVRRLVAELPDLMELENKLGSLMAGTLIHRDTEVSKIGPPSDPSKSVGRVEAQQARSRRVSLRSPVEEPEAGTPPSISEEREARRRAQPPRSIIKETMSQPVGGTSSLTLQDAEGESRRLSMPSRAHTLYNRPVLSSVSTGSNSHPPTLATTGPRKQTLAEGAAAISKSQRKRQRDPITEQPSLWSRPAPKRQRMVAISHSQQISRLSENESDLGRFTSQIFKSSDDSENNLARAGQEAAESSDSEDRDPRNAKRAQSDIGSKGPWGGRLRQSSMLRTYGSSPSQSSSQTTKTDSQSQNSAAAAIAFLTSSQSSSVSTGPIQKSDSQEQELPLRHRDEH